MRGSVDRPTRRWLGALNGRTVVKPRLYVLLARGARVGVVFRRGPSKQMLLVRWDTEHDIFEAGQWFKGRIYERRCDLSPSGDRLVYFAAKFKDPPHTYTWTAVSRPPSLTALALWPMGHTGGGGGLFSTENRLLLNHPPEHMSLAEGFRLPHDVKVEGLRPLSDRSEDQHMLGLRLPRDGWVLSGAGKRVVERGRASVRLKLEPPGVWSKLRPVNSVQWELRMRTLGFSPRNVPWTLADFELVDRRKETGDRVSLGRADWADWCSSGDLLLARDGRIFRARMGSRDFDPTADLRELIDLSSLRFEERQAPDAARTWTGPRPQGVRLESHR